MLLPPPHPKQATVGQSGGLTNQNINSPIYWAVPVLKFPRKAKDRRLLRILQIPFYPCSSYEFIKFLTIGPLSSVNPPPHNPRQVPNNANYLCGWSWPDNPLQESIYSCRRGLPALLGLYMRQNVDLSLMHGVERNHLSAACRMMTRFWLWVSKLSWKTWKPEVKIYIGAGLSQALFQVWFPWEWE